MTRKIFYLVTPSPTSSFFDKWSQENQQRESREFRMVRQGLNWTPDDFARELSCEFKADERIQKLEERLSQYYSETGGCSQGYAAQRWKAFKEWCSYGDYSSVEINRAKKHVTNLVR